MKQEAERQGKTQIERAREEESSIPCLVAMEGDEILDAALDSRVSIILTMTIIIIKL